MHDLSIIFQVVNWALQKLSLCRYKDQQTGTLSGGNKRKLSTAISLIGNPKLILMVCYFPLWLMRYENRTEDINKWFSNSLNLFMPSSPQNGIWLTVQTLISRRILYKTNGIFA